MKTKNEYAEEMGREFAREFAEQLRTAPKNLNPQAATEGGGDVWDLDYVDRFDGWRTGPIIKG